jgi:hypothetical protein
MSYIGNSPSSIAFLTDTFNGTGSQTAYTLSAAPASTSSILVAVSGVLQDPSTYGVTGLTLTFSAAPPSGTGNISVRYLGIPASGVTTTAYRTVTEFTATASQTTFTPPSYTVGFINVYRNGVLLGSADYTATNGTTVVLATGATSGDLVTVESFQVSSVLNAIPASPASVDTSYLVDGAVTAAKLDTTGTANSSTYLRGDMAWSSLPASGKLLQVVQGSTTTQTTTSSTSFVDTNLSASITPSSASNKVLILVSGPLYGGNTGYNVYASAGLLRGSTALIYTTHMSDNQAGSGVGVTVAASLNMQYLDSPATTSSTTYKIQIRSQQSSYSPAVYFPFQSGMQTATATITLMEIAA